MRAILANVDAERDRQDAKWGEQNHNVFVWLGILIEEAGEAAKAALEGKPMDCHKELIEAAAVASAAAECIERNPTMPNLTALQQELAAYKLRDKPAQPSRGGCEECGGSGKVPLFPLSSYSRPCPKCGKE